MHTGSAGSSRAYHNNVPHPAERRASTSKRRLVSLSARMQSWCISGHGALNADRVFPCLLLRLGNVHRPRRAQSAQRALPPSGQNPNSTHRESPPDHHYTRASIPIPGRQRQWVPYILPLWPSPRRRHARSTFSFVFRSDVDITLFLSTAPVSSSSGVTPARRPILAERRTQSIAGVAVAEMRRGRRLGGVN